jgi:hypothetical protein
MADAKKTEAPKEIAGGVKEGDAPLALGAPLPPSGDETPLPVVPVPLVTVTRAENGTVTNQIGSG